MLDAWLHTVLQWFALPSNGLATVLVVSFVSATLLPVGSEPAVFGYIKLNPEQFWLAVAVATVGNTLGGTVNYWLGRGAKRAIAKDSDARYLGWLRRLGPKTLFLSFLPVIGDPLCALAGWLKLPFGQAVAWMAAGRLVRYVAMTAMLLWVPDTWWARLLAPFAN